MRKNLRKTAAVLLSLLLFILPLSCVWAFAAEGCAHLHTEDVEESFPTCCRPGYTAGVYCSDCEQYISGHAEKPLKAHAWDEGAVTKKPTCSAPGVMTYRCTVKSCGASKEEPIKTDPDAHVFRVTVYDPTCTDGGYTSYACTECRYGFSADETDPLGHVYGIRITPPTCMKGGITTYTCTRCRDSFTKNPTDPVPHTDFDGDGYCDYGCGTKICPLCGEAHAGPLGGITALFHRIMYFVRNLFGG